MNTTVFSLVLCAALTACTSQASLKNTTNLLGKKILYSTQKAPITLLSCQKNRLPVQSAAQEELKKISTKLFQPIERLLYLKAIEQGYTQSSCCGSCIEHCQSFAKDMDTIRNLDPKDLIILASELQTYYSHATSSEKKALEFFCSKEGEVLRSKIADLQSQMTYHNSLVEHYPENTKE